MVIQEYLKKYSVINNEFINDFFSLYDRNTTENDFVVNIETIAKWLKTTKGHLKETLINLYSLNIDYKTKKGKINGGRPLIKFFVKQKFLWGSESPNEIVLLTPDCFKRLIMNSKTKKAEEVRTYFIELEKHIDKYKNHIIEALDKKINILENNQKPKVKNIGGVIYMY